MMKIKLTKKCFCNGIGTLTNVFNNIKVTDERLDTWYSFLNGCEDEYFTKAIEEICTMTKEIYPSTNIVALILERYDIIKEDNSENFV